MIKHKFIVSDSHSEFEKLLNICQKEFDPHTIETHHALAASGGGRITERFSARISYGWD